MSINIPIREPLTVVWVGGSNQLRLIGLGIQMWSMGGGGGRGNDNLIKIDKNRV